MSVSLLAWGSLYFFVILLTLYWLKQRYGGDDQ